MSQYLLNQDWHLFIDNAVIGRATGFDRVVHHPRAMGVVLPADKPWETAAASMSFVQRLADGSFIAHYRTAWWNSKINAPANDRAHKISAGIAYATSEDGIHWDKPNLGLVDAPAAVDWTHEPFPDPKGTTRENNLGVPYTVIAGLGLNGNVKDPRRRYALRLVPESDEILASTFKNTHGYFATELPDFLHDKQWAQKLTDSGTEFNPRRHLLHFYDDINEEWVAMEQGVIGHWYPSREIARMASKDLKNWTGDSVIYPDPGDPHEARCYDEPMSLMPFCAEGAVFGLLSWFHSDRDNEGGPNFADPSKPVGHVDHWPWCRKGINEMRITISRDGGKTWDRTSSRSAWIPHGTEEDSYDRLVIGALPPVRVDDEDWFYITVINGDHLGICNNPQQSSYYHDRLPVQQTALYIQKHNRYVSLTAHKTPEILITKPMQCIGDSLQLNVNATRGEVRVAVASAQPFLAYDDTTPLSSAHLAERMLLPGFTFDDCEPVCNSSTEQILSFKNAHPKSLKGRAVRLLFKMRDADLYGFRMP